MSVGIEISENHWQDLYVNPMVLLGYLGFELLLSQPGRQSEFLFTSEPFSFKLQEPVDIQGKGASL